MTLIDITQLIGLLSSVIISLSAITGTFYYWHRGRELNELQKRNLFLKDLNRLEKYVEWKEERLIKEGNYVPQSISEIGIIAYIEQEEGSNEKT